MDLHSGLPYWPLLHGIMSVYPSLSKDISCEVAIIGGGITGAIVAWHLAASGYEVVVLDRRHIAMGSTAASTALLQYELDIPLTTLAKQKGEHAATRSYLLCEKAVKEVGILCERIGAGALYQENSSFQFASFKKDREWLKQEFLSRRKAGIEVEWMDAGLIEKRYGINKPGGILSETGAGVDAYALTHRLLEPAPGKNITVYDHTEINRIDYQSKAVMLHTSENRKIKARKLIIACGYESEQFLPFKIQQLYSTYAIISELFATGDFWYENSMIWETARPYLYMRTTYDNRILVGGKDIQGADPGKRYRLLPAKVKQLERSFKKLFPAIHFKTDFSWAGTFAATKDGLPYMGCVNNCPHSFFVLGLGGNGIPFAMIAAELVQDWLKQKINKDAALFSFER